MSDNLEKELKEAQKKVQELTLVLKQVLNLVTVSSRADSSTILSDIKNIIEAELK